MLILYYFLVFAFILGNLASVSTGTGVRVSLLDLGVTVFVIGFFLRSKFRRYALKRYTQLFGPFILVAALSLILQLNHFSPLEIGISSLYLIRFIMYSLITIVIAYSSQLKKRVLLGLWFGGVVIGILGLLQYFLYPNLRNLSYLGWDPHEFRIFSTLLDPNFTGIILVLTLLLSWYSYRKKYLKSQVLFLPSGLTFLALLLTYSRGSFVALVSGILIITLLQKKLKLLVVCMIILIGGIGLLPKPTGEGVNMLRTISILSRLKDNEEALTIFSKAPLLGSGFDTLRFARGQTQIVSGTDDVSHSGAGFHNSWLFLLVTTGIIGLLAYAWIWKKIFMSSNLLDHELVVVSATSVFVHSLFDNSLFYPHVMLWMWVLVGYSLHVIPLKHVGRIEESTRSSLAQG